MITKGIVLSAGRGTRLLPLTKYVNKQMLPVYDKILIQYPVELLINAGINDILIIVNPEQQTAFETYFDGLYPEVRIQFAKQYSSKGIADAFIIGEEFIDKDGICLILGDNVFFGDVSKILNTVLNQNIDLATIFLSKSKTPEKYGVAVIQNKTITDIIEKPTEFVGNKVVSGLYVYPNSVIEYAKNLKPSKRGELEITDINNIYLKNYQLAYHTVQEFRDCGNPDDLLDCAVRIRDTRMGAGR